MERDKQDGWGSKDRGSKSASIATLKKESGRACTATLEQEDKSAGIAALKCERASKATLEQEARKKGNAKWVRIGATSKMDGEVRIWGVRVPA